MGKSTDLTEITSLIWALIFHLPTKWSKRKVRQTLGPLTRTTYILLLQKTLS